MSDSGAPDEKKPWMSSRPSMYRQPAERLPVDLFSYTREAGNCLQGRRFLACISMASTAVETILNRDQRLRTLPDYKAPDGWAYLNNRTLRTARENGLPTNKLLSPGDDLNGRKPILFVELRNKIAHGEITRLVTDLSDYDPSAEQMAADQETKMRLIVSEWFITAADVQEGHIRKNRWPDTVQTWPYFIERLEALRNLVQARAEI
jgi:hypothetical protein